MSELESIIEHLRITVGKFQKECEYLTARNDRLESENMYLKKQVDVLLKVIGKESYGD